jgi:hypothetical protein
MITQLGDHCRGVLHYRTRMSEQDIRDIRKARREGVPLKILARRYGVTPPAISAIDNRRTWGHVS